MESGENYIVDYDTTCLPGSKSAECRLYKINSIEFFRDGRQLRGCFFQRRVVVSLGSWALLTSFVCSFFSEALFTSVQNQHTTALGIYSTFEFHKGTPFGKQTNMVNWHVKSKPGNNCCISLHLNTQQNTKVFPTWQWIRHCKILTFII